MNNVAHGTEAESEREREREGNETLCLLEMFRHRDTPEYVKFFKSYLQIPSAYAVFFCFFRLKLAASPLLRLLFSGVFGMAKWNLTGGS